MSSAFVDVDEILTENDQWAKLEEMWGKPIDLDTEEEQVPVVSPSISSLDLKKSTFDSSFIFKTARKKLGGERLTKLTASALGYENFLNELKTEKRISQKQYYDINGVIISDVSIENIYDKIDDIFRSIDKLASASSTLRRNSKYLPEIVNCSMSVDGLSFDETVASSNESDIVNIDVCIEEALERLNSTIASLDGVDESTIDTVTTLVRKFSNILNSPLNRIHKMQNPCCEKFKDLAAFWNSRAFNE